ncbi:MAG: zinc-dependent peptidase [Deltaproteobacteria bacterium]|nr:zinc-dependent peptidase [Deltaproteobacteria bacterium]
MFGLYRRWRRARLRGRPLPAEWLVYLQADVPFFSLLEGELRERFLSDLQVFVLEKHERFYGASGLELGDRHRVVISAAAVRLTLHLGLEHLDRVKEIVVYPHAYRHPGREGGILGEVHTFGTIVLSWPSVLSGLKNLKDGHDTATHEFAHAIDLLDGSFDGIPELRAREDYVAFLPVMHEHFERLRAENPQVRKVLRPYGATNAAEFFAVATEAFFEKPRQMQKRTPELYGVMQAFYGFDPASDDLDGVPSGRKVGRNDLCPCGSGQKYKRCCLPRLR